MSNHIANKIEAKDKSLSEVLIDKRFKIDVFQREYMWKRKHIEDLISDLSISFLGNFQTGDSQEKYNSYDSYYMGPIVVCENNGSLSIVDGQQRLTSFTLLLLYLNQLQRSIGSEQGKPKDLEKYIYVDKGGRESLILDIETRNDIIKHLYKTPNEVYKGDTKDESVQNIIERYEDITKLFPEEIKNKDVLPLFIEWLLYKVVMVEVKAFSMENAYNIFETMNDRGLNLSPTEMLKGYLLSKVDDDNKSYELNDLWKNKIAEIKTNIGSDADLDFFRAWLRAKYADTIRATKQGASNEDFEIIGTQFHTWVRSNSPEKTGLTDADDHYFFIQSDFDYFSSLYVEINEFRKNNNKDHNLLYISNFYTIADSLSNPLYLSSITKIDDDKTVSKKMDLIGKFIDVYTNKRVLTGKAITQSSIRYSMYDLVKSIRNSGIEELTDKLEVELNKNFGKITSTYSEMHPMDNWGYYHYFYSRIIYHLEQKETPDFKELLRSRKQSSYILVQLFDSEELESNSELGEVALEKLANSVGAFALIRRYNYYEDGETSFNSSDRLESLIEKKYFPEMENVEFNPKNIVEFITKRNAVLKDLVDTIWEF